MKAFKSAAISAAKWFRPNSFLSYLVNWGFWSAESEADYYSSLEDNTPYYSLTEKE